MASEPGLRVVVVYAAAAREVWETSLVLGAGSNVKQAVEASGVLRCFPALQLESLDLGIWGRKAALTHTLRDQDRIEIYRPLTVDPKVARRERFAKQGARTAGLFKTKRDGAKAGY
jgi:uncharacterized protein